MKKWFKFFGLSFFSHKTSREGMKHGYTSVFLSFVLAVVFLWGGFLGGDMLPFATHYKNAPDLKGSAYKVFANSDPEKRIIAELCDGGLKVKRQGGKYTDLLLINTLENDEDKATYSQGGFNIVVDNRPADTLAEIEAYCVSNDGKETVITYEDYLTLSEVARLNFDFKMRYTGEPLELSDEMVGEYLSYLDGLSDEVKAKAESIAKDLSDEKITKSEYNREIYKLYFTNYYPEIKEYESSSEVPLYRNYYYHQYISQGITDYLFIFDDYMAGSFETKGGIDVQFYGFYREMENGLLIKDGSSGSEAEKQIDGFIRSSFKANWFLNLYAHTMNIITLMPFVALMLMVAALLSYSLLKLWGAESISSLGAMLKIVGSFQWFSGLIAALFALIIGFLAGRGPVTSLSLVAFFLALVVRSMIFVIQEKNLYTKQSEKQSTEQTEV